MASPGVFKCYEKTAFIVGYTGDVGKDLVKELLEKKIFKKLFLIGRRSVEYTDPLYSATEQKIVDFDNLENYKEAFRDIDYGFCCLGTTKAAAGVEGFIKVDHDYVVSCAKVAKESGCQQFSLISATNANKDSTFLYPKTKGLTEQHVTEIGFNKLVIARPSFILVDKPKGPIGKYLLGGVLKPVVWCKPTWLSVPCNKVAKAMIYSTCMEPSGQKAVDIMSNAKLHEIAECYEKLFENKN